MEKRFKYLEHTADSKFQAFGKTLEEAFGNAALAMFNEIVDINTVRCDVQKSIEVIAKKKTTLLYEFLENLLYLLDTEGFLLGKILSISIKSDEVEDRSLSLNAVIAGDSASGGYEVIGAIKSVTYSDMIIDEKHEKGVMVQVLIDI
ncbi:archease [Candidatus Woesearchaeota archaeon]|nr:archease [Candidatus Woesearchaeota archaeon]